ncbi:hypothetical protein [Rhizobium leguminosarum]|uniref:hypothetical protein n=1 Tax=Rhizobium leguminosarum TaxID=384 RepID=UPI0021BBCCA0|nr:hypothetical protein [Rhizobium leguminosarum]
MAGKRQWIGARIEKPAPADNLEKQAIIAACEAFIRDILKPRFLPEIRLMAVQAESLGPEEVAPLPGLGPMTDALETFAQFFGLDADLVAAAAERPAETTLAGSTASDAVRSFVAAMPDNEKTMMLTRLIEGDPHVASELQKNARSFSAGTKPAAAPPTIAELQTRAGAIRHNRERKENERLAAERKKQEAEEARARRARLNAIIQRGDAVWREIEVEIERRNASGYDRAASCLAT